MFNPNAVLGQADSGAVPSNWKILRATSSYFVSQIFLGIALTVLGAVLGVALFNSDTVFGFAVNVIDNAIYQLVWLAIDYLFVLAMFVGGIVIIIRHLIQLGGKDGFVMVLTPEGVVVRNGRNVKKILVIDFANLIQLTATTSNRVRNLVLTPKQGKMFTIQVPAQYGKIPVIEQSILAYWNTYQPVTVPTTPSTDQRG